MACSDTRAEMLEASDPQFRERNEHNARARALMVANCDAMCRYGEALWAGTLTSVDTLPEIAVPDNVYVQRDRELYKAMGTIRNEEEANAAARASIDLAEAVTGRSDGRVAFDWLIEHWTREADYKHATNLRHRQDLLRLPADSAKAQKRIALLAVDEPFVELRRKQIKWAQAQL